MSKLSKAEGTADNMTEWLKNSSTVKFLFGLTATRFAIACGMTLLGAGLGLLVGVTGVTLYTNLVDWNPLWAGLSCLLLVVEGFAIVVGSSEFISTPSAAARNRG